MSLDYYQRPFITISQPIIREIIKQPHLKRKSYWSLVPEREYNYLQAKRLVLEYYDVVLKEIEEIISSKSRIYWLHLSRRILPSTSGKDKSPITIGATRKIIDAAIEKYGKDEFCKCVGITGDINISEVFDGLLLSEYFEYERELLEKLPRQVVLTKFNQTNMLEYYTLEKLAYEVWKCGATLRALGKGAIIKVIHSDKEYFTELRSPELDFLINNYDDRKFSFITSRKGVVLEDQDDKNSGILFVPTYNIANTKINIINSIFKQFEIPLSFGDDMVTNFIPIAYPLRGFYNNNKPLFAAFSKKYKIEVVSILTVITAVAYRIFHKFFLEKELGMVKPFFLRGYQGPILENDILKELEYYKNFAFLNLDLNEQEKKTVNITDGYNFLKVENRELIDLLFAAPLKLFIPVSSNRLIIDYSKIPQILDDLMFQVGIDNENFKGDLFELVTNKTKSILPNNQCFAFDNSSKQIDYAIAINNIIIICECKLKENSIGYYKGNMESIESRRKEVIDKSINESNEKAIWLSRNPKGKNYDISKFKYLLPVGLSAFKEFTPSTNKKYWISDTIPRVLTIEEFNKIIDNKSVSDESYNIIEIEKSTDRSDINNR
ncbi:hypothetical protein [Flavobacterium urumqiense]|uniref:Uncharacterized protein n=1 Tax=Flavobacterium urumqiense TaxID=935224 RepID=A0A1H6ANX2_9FLAO|nr:hypothetical protein [Flavobacterium urumqiense]SEG50102.1 hypothetical protein SAMN04488130_11813 [Flavobacterium urumqiense]